MASHSARVPYSVSGCSNTPAGPLTNTVPAAAIARAVRVHGGVAEVDDLLADRQVGRRDLDALAVRARTATSAGSTTLSPCAARIAFDSSMNGSSWLALMNSMDGAPMSTPLAASMTLATRPAVSTWSTTPSAQRRLHHRERLLDLGAAEEEHARPRRLLAQARQVGVLLLEQPAHGRRQQLLEARPAWAASGARRRTRRRRRGRRAARACAPRASWPGPRARGRACARRA